MTNSRVCNPGKAIVAFYKMMARRLAILSAALSGFLVGAPADAADLRAVRSSDETTVYIDLETISRGDNLLKVWAVWDHATEQVNLYGENYRSAALHNEFDCGSGTVRLLEIAEYPEPLASGELVRAYPGHEAQPRKVPDGSISSAIFDEVCSAAGPAASDKRTSKAF